MMGYNWQQRNSVVVAVLDTPHDLSHEERTPMTILDHTTTSSDEQEEWRPVLGYEGFYEVARRGLVRRIGAGRALKAGSRKGPYPRVSLCRGGIVRRLLVHVLVARAFLGPCPEGYEVNHRDGDKTRPGASNLEYVTRSENIRHSYAVLGRVKAQGGRNPNAKLCADDIVAIRQSAETCRALGRKYGVDHSVISRVKRGHIWGHVDG